MPLEPLGGALEAMGFARAAPDEPIREDELEVVPLLQLGLSTGILDQVWLTRLGRGYQEGLRLIARVEREVWQARFMAPLLASGADQQTARGRRPSSTGAGSQPRVASDGQRVNARRCRRSASTWSGTWIGVGVNGNGRGWAPCDGVLSWLIVVSYSRRDPVN